MARLLCCVAFGIPTGLALFAVVFCAVMYAGSPTWLSESSYP